MWLRLWLPRNGAALQARAPQHHRQQKEKREHRTRQRGNRHRGARAAPSAIIDGSLVRGRSVLKALRHGPSCARGERSVGDAQALAGGWIRVSGPCWGVFGQASRSSGGRDGTL